MGIPGRYLNYITFATLASALPYLGCEAPDVHPAPWLDVAGLPSGFELGAAGPDGLYGVIEGRKLVKYANGRLEEEYVWPEDVHLWALAFKGTTGWACGNRLVGEDSEPFVARRDRGSPL
jgi:hypothetical protein